MKLSLFAEDMALYTENPKDAAENYWKLINESGNVAGDKINTLKSLASQHTHSERIGKEIKETIPLPLLRRIQYQE